MLPWILWALLVICAAGAVRFGLQCLREEEQRIKRAGWVWAQRYYTLRDELDKDLS